MFKGMMVGWYLHKTKCQVRIPYCLVAVGWPCSLAIFGSLIFGMVDGYFEVWPTAFYVSIGHTGSNFSSKFRPYFVIVLHRICICDIASSTTA